MMIACGFCLAGPTLLILPLLLVWFGLFLVWSGWVGKYDPAMRQARRRWILCALVLGPVGAVVSIELWTFSLLAWTYAVVRRVQGLRNQVALPTSGDLSAPELNPDALRFHVQILIFLGCGLVLKAILARIGIGFVI